MRCIVVLFFILTRCLYAQSTIPYKLQDIGVTEKLGITITVNHQFKDPVLDKIVYFDDFFKASIPSRRIRFEVIYKCLSLERTFDSAIAIAPSSSTRFP